MFDLCAGKGVFLVDQIAVFPVSHVLQNIQNFLTNTLFRFNNTCFVSCFTTFIPIHVHVSGL